MDNCETCMPPELALAQESIHLPEVLSAMRLLAKYNLGVFMPHMHDPRTGEFQVLPSDVVTYENGLKVSFESMSKLSEDNVIPVAWIWSEGGPGTVAGCISKQISRQGFDSDGKPYHHHGTTHEVTGE